MSYHDIDKKVKGGIFRQQPSPSGGATKEKLGGPENTKLPKYTKQGYQIGSKQQFSALLDSKQEHYFCCELVNCKSGICCELVKCKEQIFSGLFMLIGVEFRGFRG